MFFRKILCLALMPILIAMCGCTPSSESNSEDGKKATYNNPVWQPILADPSVIRHEGVYYVYGTEDNGIWSETESGLRSIPILSSTDLINWKYAGQVFTSYAATPKWGSLNANLWAPDIVKIGDKFVLYYSLSKWGDPDPGIGVAVAEHPLGPWTDKGQLLRSGTIGVSNSIDPTVFCGYDGKMYIIWGSFRGLYGAELTADGLAFADGEQQSVNKTQIAAGGKVAVSYEGAYILKKDGKYFMFVSSGTCCNGHESTYNVKVAQSDNPLGPYTDDLGRNMMATGVGKQVIKSSGRFAGTGHNCVTTDDAGNYYIIYHGFDRNEQPTVNGTNRRSLLIDLLLWDKDGWPYVENYEPSETKSAPVINDK